MLFLKVFNVGDNFDSRLRQFHIVVPLFEKHFWPFTDFRMGISKSDLVLRNPLLLVSESLENISVRKMGARSLIDLYTILNVSIGIISVKMCQPSFLMIGFAEASYLLLVTILAARF